MPTATRSRLRRVLRGNAVPLPALALALTMVAASALAQAPAPGPAPAASQGGPAAQQQPPAREVVIGYLSWQDDPRYDEKRMEREFPANPAARPFPGAALALSEADFALEAQGLQVRLDEVEAGDQAAAFAALDAWAASGVPAVVLDLPGDWVEALATHLDRLGEKAPLLINSTADDDRLRGASCHPQVFHVTPSERMRTDALAQLLAARRWPRVLVLQGPSEDDQRLGQAFAQSLRKFGLKPVATRPFKLSNDPRERELGNIALLTGNIDYDAVAVMDADGEFAREVPFKTVLPRPVVGSNGVIAQAWHPHFERYGAPQLNKRFRRTAKRPMSGWDWSVWMAVKTVTHGLAVKPDAGPAELRTFLRSPQTILDGFKGVRLNFRPWDQQLRQPVFLGYGDGIVGVAPFEGFLHQRDTLDTLGADRPESTCKAIKE
jgi:ABC transporter substrate binding protein (PQQ-dependent alcohol dehydrogenase system)